MKQRFGGLLCVMVGALFLVGSSLGTPSAGAGDIPICSQLGVTPICPTPTIDPPTPTPTVTPTPTATATATATATHPATATPSSEPTSDDPGEPSSSPTSAGVGNGSGNGNVTTGGSDLPFTGFAHARAEALGGLSLLLLGAVLLLAGRPRKQRTGA